MAVAERAGIPPFLMTIMVAHGCIAGALSPIAPTGIIANGLMAPDGDVGIRAAELPLEPRWPTPRSPRSVIWPSAAGGCSGSAHEDEHREATPAESDSAMACRVTGSRWRRSRSWSSGSSDSGVHVGMGAFAAAVVLTLAKVTDEKPVIPALPWSVIMMVCGVTVLTVAPGEDRRNRPVHDASWRGSRPSGPSRA